MMKVFCLFGLNSKVNLVVILFFFFLPKNANVVTCQLFEQRFFFFIFITGFDWTSEL